MWFLTIESFALLAVATALGLFAGWLVWGGTPALSAVPTFVTTSNGADVEPIVEPIAPRILVEVDPGSISIDPVSDSQAASQLVDAVVSQIGTQFVPGLDSEDKFDGVEPLEHNETQNDGTEYDPTHSNATDDSSLHVIVDLRNKLDETAARLQTREDDVVRLKTKLRRAVEEIEKRTAIAQAARAELLEHQQLVARQTTSRELLNGEADNVVGGGQNQSTKVSAELGEGELSTPHFTQEEIDDLIRARTASLLIQTSQLERRSALAQSRAEEAEARVVALKEEIAQHDAEAQALLAKSEQDAANRILALEMDLASARQRVTVASNELMGFGSEITAIRETNAKHLQSVHDTMRELQHRLDTTKAALAGRSVDKLRQTNQSNRANYSGASRYGDSNTQSGQSVHLGGDPEIGPSLLTLPGMTPQLVDSLLELGVTSLEDIASWTSEDVSRIQSWLPENPAIVERYGWVPSAQQALREAPAPMDA